MEENSLVLFEQKYVDKFNELSDLKKQKELLEKIEKDVKEELERAMDEYGIKSVKTDKITISRVEESTSTSIDLKQLEKKEPELYSELLVDYPKVTTKKAYVKFLVK